MSQCDEAVSLCFERAIKTVLTDRPTDPVNNIESYFTENIQQKPPQCDTRDNGLLRKQLQLFHSTEELTKEEIEDDGEVPLPNLHYLSYYFEKAGVGVGREETYKILLALNQLGTHQRVSDVRFWGKIFGLNANYIIAEVEYHEGEGDEGKNGDEESSKAETKDEDETLTVPGEYDDLPKSNWKAPPTIPSEEHHFGTNKKVYFVCNEPGDEWIRLPHAKPLEIQASRDIHKFFTGQLSAGISSYPTFPGKEVNYLRAMIARISATTQISPTGFYMLGEEDEEEEVQADTFVKNTDFEGLSLSSLTDPSLNDWVHHTQYILPQGRCNWFNPYSKPEELEEVGELGSVQSSIGDAEASPPLLTAIKDDSCVGDLPAWSVAASSKLLPGYAIAVAKSNLWPGAFAIAKGKIFDTVYIGFGLKYLPNPFNPKLPDLTFNEYLKDSEIEEQEDPSLVMERNHLNLTQQAMKLASGNDDTLSDDED